MDNLYSRRTSSKLSLSTNNGAANAGDSSASSRNATLPRRFGGDSSSHGKTNPFNSATTPGGRLMSPTSASSAFGLGSGAFSSFGSAAKTPKSPGQPFDFASKSSASATATSASTSTTSLAGEKSSAATPRAPASAPAPAPAAPSSTGSNASGTAAGAEWNSGRRYALRSEWVFWFRPPISKANGYIEYEKTLHPMAAVSTVEDFFTVYSHLKRPSTLPLVSDYHLFRKGIRPIWEDAENRKGGKWIVRLKKGVADRYWEDLLFAIVGDQFGDAADEVCGAVLSVRNGEDILSVWARNDGGRVLRIRETMKRLLGFPLDTKVEWKSHDSSIQQRSAIEESRREKQPSSHHHHHNNNNNGSNNSSNGSHHHHNDDHRYQHRQSDKRPSKQATQSSEEPPQQPTYGRGPP